MERQSLSEILHGNERDGLAAAWDSTEAAEDFAPLPAGEYVARVVSGELFTSKTNHTPGYKITFRICEGDHEGRQFWADCWLTEAALPMTKRDLAKLGVTKLEQLEQPLPQGIRVRAKVVLRKDDDGTEYNRVRSFEFVSIDEPAPDPFAPDDLPSDAEDGAELDASTDEDEGDSSFPYGANAVAEGGAS